MMEDKGGWWRTGKDDGEWVDDDGGQGKITEDGWMMGDKGG